MEDLQGSGRVKSKSKGPIKLIGSFAIVVFSAIMFFQAIAWNSANLLLVHQSVTTGDLKVITEAGPYLKAFGTVTEYSKVMAVSGTGDENADGTTAIGPVPVRFLDTTTGKARVITRYRMPVGEKLLVIHTEFGSGDALRANLLVNTVKEAAKASARLMSVEQHYSGANGKLSQDFSDQLTHGIYVVDQKISISSSKKSKKGGEEDTLQNQQRVTVTPRINKETGNIERASNSLQAYGIVVVDARIIDVDYEPKVDARLEAQKQAAADEALARQNLKKAEQQARTEVALGEQAIAKQRAESQREKEQARIAAEQAKEVATIASEQKVEVARQLSLEQAQVLAQQRLQAEGMAVLAAARRKAKDNALDPKYVFEQKLAAEVAIKTALYQNLGKANLVPQIQMGSSGKSASNGVDLLQVLAANASMELNERMKSR